MCAAGRFSSVTNASTCLARSTCGAGESTITEGTSTTDRVCSVVRLTTLPGFNGRVSAISEPDASGTRYVGGNFTAWNAYDLGGSADVDATLGAVDARFPKVRGTVQAAAPDGSGGFCIGGNFTLVNGVSCTNAAHLLSDGSLDPNWMPNPNNHVWALAVSGSTVYLGGSFTTVGGTPQGYSATVAP